MAINSLINESKTKQCTVEGCDRGQRSNGLCGKHYQRVRTYGSTDLPPPKPVVWATCSIEDCSNLSRTVAGAYCEMHYCRQWRTGSYEAREKAPYRKRAHGYLSRVDRAHPMSGVNGMLYQHRQVLYDAIGDGLHNCYWCKTEIQWKAKCARKLVVDHLDGDKANNELSNLKPSCNKCNASRGLFQHWVMRHKDDPFLAKLFATASS